MKIDKYHLGDWFLDSHEIDWEEMEDQEKFMERNKYTLGERVGGYDFEPHAVFYNSDENSSCLVDIYLDEAVCYMIFIENPVSRLHFLKEYGDVFKKHDLNFVPYGGLYPKGYLNKSSIKNIEVIRNKKKMSVIANTVCEGDNEYILLDDVDSGECHRFMHKYFGTGE